MLQAIADRPAVVFHRAGKVGEKHPTHPFPSLMRECEVLETALSKEFKKITEEIVA